MGHGWQVIPSTKTACPVTEDRPLLNCARRDHRPSPKVNESEEAVLLTGFWALLPLLVVQASGYLGAVALVVQL